MPTPRTLAGATWLAMPSTRAVLDALGRAGHEARIVGGAVRNTLMGFPVTDIDIASTATPVEIVAAATAAGLKSVPTGIDHGTITVIAEGDPFEV
ncbi:MAG TPA: CCA tRNA nucleotidyltransferase, partial [Hyphomicrobiaceae bacterium]|nr:CCA tRNA nucleotidyltransferase [Hyphomicrobiaceae bacterium]